MECVVKTRIKNKEIFWGTGVVDLLEFIKQCDSLKKACESMGMSYSKGHRIIKRAEQELGFSIVCGSKGGVGGGGSALTKEGQEFLKCYKEFETAMEEYGKDLFSKIFNQYL